MKRKIKDILAAIVYFLYEKRILPNKIKVHTLDETIDVLLQTEKSMVRFGDGEIVMIKGGDLMLQKASPEISRGLGEILRYEYDDLMVTLPDIFDTLRDLRPASRQFWKDHLLFCRKIYETYCNPNRIYGSSFISRCYYYPQDRSKCADWFAKIKKIWENKAVVVVEGERSHNGIGNDLLNKAASIERIICPPSDAYGALPQISEACKRYGTDRLFLLSVGVAAKFLALDLFRSGYRVLDIGNLDLEYEWFVRQTSDKIALEKHSVVGRQANQAMAAEEKPRQITIQDAGGRRCEEPVMGYGQYLQQVKVWL